MEDLITFTPLQNQNLTFLHKWLNAQHINVWWGNKTWKVDDINEKYLPYTRNTSKVKAHIIWKGIKPIGYIQYYKVSDFPDGLSFDIHSKMAGVDFLIGEKEFLGTGLARQIITHYMEEIIPQEFKVIIADPLIENKRAVNFFKNSGFVEYCTTKKRYT